MSERAKQIALKIIATAWPGRLVTQGMIDGTAAAVERHMLCPHQVRDHVGIIWEQMSDGCYRTLNGAKTDYIDRNFGPLTEVQGEPMPDAGEIERLKVRIAELEKRSKELVLSSAEVRGVCGKQKERIAELEKKISEYSRDLIDSKKHVDDLQGWLAEERSISAMRASQLSEMEEDRMSMIETSARLRDLCDRQQKQIAELEKQLADKTESLDSLKSRHYEMSQELESLKALSPEKASLMSKIDSLEREKQADSIVISMNRRERDDMVNRIVELERQLADEKKKGDDVWKALKYEQSLSSRRAVQIEKLENELKQAKAVPAKPLTAKEHIEAAIDLMWVACREQLEKRSWFGVLCAGKAIDQLRLLLLSEAVTGVLS